MLNIRKFPQASLKRLGEIFMSNFFYIVKDMTEEFIYNWRFIDEKEYDEIQKNLRERNIGNVDEK